MDIERGNYFRALGRYNGSLGKPQYPNLVVNTWRKHWDYASRSQTLILSLSYFQHCPKLRAVKFHKTLASCTKMGLDCVSVSLCTLIPSARFFTVHPTI